MSEAGLCSRGRVLSAIIAGTVALVVMARPLAAQPQGSASVYRQTPVFVENRGQWQGDFRYATRLGAMTVFVQEKGWTFTLVEHREKPADPDDPVRDVKRGGLEVARACAVGMRFAATAGAQGIVAGRLAAGVHHYFPGNDPGRWRTGVPLHESVRLERPWPGIDVEARTEAGHFEYDVLARPGADLTRAIIEVDGALHLELEEDGTLVIETALGPVRQPAPSTWQVTADRRREPIACDYVLLGNMRFGFSAPSWDGRLPLVIDPGLLFSTFLGAFGIDRARAVAVDVGGATTMAGETNHVAFPATTGAFDTGHNGSTDAFVARLNPYGTLLFSTFLGGTGSDACRGAAVDGSGGAIVVGERTSTDFPTTPGSYDPTSNGSSDAFVTRLNPAGDSLLYSTYLGGAGLEGANAVAVDVNGIVTVAGFAPMGFPTTPGAYDTSPNGNLDAFVARLNPTGTSLIYSTYLGHASSDIAHAIAIDDSGSAAVVGETQSAGFPMTVGAFDTSHNGDKDGFAARLNPTGSGLIYASFLGGAAIDVATAVAVDASGVATVSGYTQSATFPTTVGAYDTGFSGVTDAFILKLDAIGGALVYSTYLGGGSTDAAWGIALEASGGATVAGQTSSSDFPATPGAYDTGHNGWGFRVLCGSKHRREVGATLVRTDPNLRCAQVGDPRPASACRRPECAPCNEGSLYRRPPAGLVSQADVPAGQRFHPKLRCAQLGDPGPAVQGRLASAKHRQ